MDKVSPPKGLGRAGRGLWREITLLYDATGAEPLLAELCHVQDRLSEVRQILKSEGLTVARPGARRGFRGAAPTRDRRHPLADLEPKLSAQYQKIWRLLGLADKEPEAKPGR
jgi:hypothetical protein